MGGGCFSKIAERGRREVGHQAEAAWKEVWWEGAWHLDHGAGAVLIGGGCCSDAPGEEVAEAAEARHADFHADVCDGMVARCQEALCEVEAGLDAELVRCESE